MVWGFMIFMLELCLIVAMDTIHGHVSLRHYIVLNCNICSKPVYERTVDNSTDLDNSVNNSLSCGHFTQLHTDCLMELLVLSSERIGCPICERSLKLDGNIGDAIYSKKKQQFLELRLNDERKEVFIEVLRRWPDILEIGNAKVACVDRLVLNALDCAYHILRNPNSIEYLTSLMERLETNRENTLKFLIRNQDRVFYFYRNAKVYNHYGEIISIQDAMIISFNSFTGEQVKNTLKAALGYLDLMLPVAYSHPLLNLPEIRAIQDENLFIDGTDTRYTIKMATFLMKTPMLSTQAYEDGIRAISVAFVEAESKVDKFLDKEYPHIAEFKNIKKWKSDFQKHHTIRYMAKMVLNTNLPGDDYKQKLDRYEEGAIAAKLRFLKFGDLSYQGMQYLQSYKLLNAPGGSLSMRSAILYAMHPELSREEDKLWMDAISAKFSSVLLSLRPLRSRVAGIEENFGIHEKQRKIVAIQNSFKTELQRDFYSFVNYLIRILNQVYEDHPAITAT